MASLSYRKVVWAESEQDFYVKRKDTRRVQVRGGLKFIGYDNNGLLMYRVIKSKILGSHSVHVRKHALAHYRWSLE